MGDDEQAKDPAAVALGRRGGLKAWAELTPEQRAEEMRRRWRKRPRAKKGRRKDASPRPDRA